MNWAMAESEGFRRNTMIDEEEDEEHARYLAIQGARAEEEPRSERAASTARAVSVAAGSQVDTKAEPVRGFVEREHARRQAAMGAAAGVAARRDAYLTTSSGPKASEDAWSDVRGQNRAQQAAEARDLLSQWGDVLK